LGNVRTFTYDIDYNPQSVTDTINGAPATLASFIFNADSTLAAGAIGYDISEQSAKETQYTYDSYGNKTSQTDALGRTTSYTYDTLGHRITMTMPLPSSSTNPTTATTTYTYDALGNLTQTAAPLGRTTGSTYDGNRNKLSDTDALGHITTYEYDALNRLTKTTYPTQSSTTTTRTYDFRNNVVDETDQAGHITHHVYDLAGRLTSVTKAYGTSNASTTTYAYYNDGRKQSETDALGHTTTYTYDAAGRLTALAGVNGNVGYGYDAAGNRTSSTDGDGNTTQYQYDARKRLVKAIYPNTTSVTNGYDGPGNLTSVTDQAGNTVQYTFDAANQLQSVIQVNSPNSSNNTTAYGYDKDGNLINLTDANSHSTLNTYDLLNNLTTKTLPNGSLTETRTYDTEGNLLSLQHFNGKTTTYTYDPLDRLLSRTPDSSYGESVVSFTYTATGKRASMTDASGTTNYTNDSLDQLTAKATPEGTLNYTYDAVGNVASMASSNTNGASVAYTYDSLNRLSTVVDNRLIGQNTTTYTYDMASNLVTASYPNNSQSTFHYDQLNRLTALTTPNSGYLYQLGPTGNRTNATELTGRTLNWNYDGIYRLTSEAVSQDPAGKNGAVGYGLDPVGNRLSANSTLQGVASGTFSYDADDRLSAETYDTNGNTTLTTGGKVFTYDSENRLKSMNGSAVTLQYDGDGNRVAKTTTGVTTRYLVDDLNPTAYAQVTEEIVNGAVQREYTYGLQRISQNQIINGTWTPSFYGYDGMGSVRMLTSTNGTVTDTYSYDAFGNLLNSTGTTPDHYLYRGEQYDSDLALYYLRARYYNPTTGRFLSRDPEDGIPTDPKTLHKYMYAGGDPVNLADPSGRATAAPTMPGRAIGGAAGEYGELVMNIALASVAALDVVACAINIQYAMDALKVDGYIDVIPWAFCSAKGRKLCSCTAKCTCHAIGMPDHGNTGVFVTGSGTASSCPAARTLAKQDAGMSCGFGSHAQHCSYQCDGR
jgi:RHS repeat-associated protein